MFPEKALLKALHFSCLSPFSIKVTHEKISCASLDFSPLSFRAEHSIDPGSRGNALNIVLKLNSDLDPGSSPE